MIEIRQSDGDDLFFHRQRNEDQSISPTRDTGFRQAPQPLFHYRRIVARVTPGPAYEYLHNDDVVVVGQATLRGMPIDRVNAVVVNQESHDAREAGYLAQQIAIGKQGS